MSDSNCTFSEQDILDFILGNVSQQRNTLISAHISNCKQCSIHFKEWTKHLEESSSMIVPSQSLKRRLKWFYFIRYHLIYLIKRYTFTWSTAVAFTGLILLIFALRGEVGPTARLANLSWSNGKMANKEIAMVMDPQTDQYEVAADETSNARGYVWLNHGSHELLILMKGGVPVTQKDYQVWFVSGQARSNAGVLDWKNGMGHFYYQDKNLEDVENIAISLEPKGGSPVPTSPDTLKLEIKERKTPKTY